jgi:hypothetical protein
VPARARVNKNIKVANHKFKLEIYLALEGHKDITWEIFPQNHSASLYAFSNKKKLDDGISRPSNDLYRKRFDEIFGKKDKTLHEELMEGFEEEKKQREEDE